MGRTAEKHRFQALDGLRGLFALIMVIYHANCKSTLTNNFIIKSADLFVDYFFVLSGFVISYNYGNNITNSTSFFRFIKKRLARLCPLLFFTVILFLLFLLAGHYFSLLNRSESLRSICLQTLDSLLLTNSTPILGSATGTNYPSWSISAEMCSYVVFGVVLVLFRKQKQVVFVGLALAFFAFFLLRAHYDYMGDFGFLRGIFCFLLGHFAYSTSVKFAQRKMDNLSEIGVTTATLFCLWLVYKTDSQYLRLLMPFVFAASIVVLVNSKGSIAIFLHSSSVQWLGQLSFSIYLNHAIVLIVFEKFFFTLLKWQQQPEVVAYFLLVSVLATIGYSYLTHKYIEPGFAKRPPKPVQAAEALTLPEQQLASG